MIHVAQLFVNIGWLLGGWVAGRLGGWVVARLGGWVAERVSALQNFIFCIAEFHFLHCRIPFSALQFFVCCAFRLIHSRACEILHCRISVFCIADFRFLHCKICFPCTTRSPVVEAGSCLEVLRWVDVARVIGWQMAVLCSHLQPTKNTCRN